MKHPHARAVICPAGPRAIGLAIALATATAVVFVVAGTVGGCKSGSADQLKEEGYLERNPIGVPPEAKLVRHSAGQSGSPLSPDSWFAPDNITFRPASPGGIWVVDEQNATVAFHGRMKAGDRLVVAPKSNDILLNKATVYHRRLPSDHGFLIYFAKDPDAPATTTAVATAPSQ